MRMNKVGVSPIDRNPYAFEEIEHKLAAQVQEEDEEDEEEETPAAVTEQKLWPKISLRQQRASPANKMSQRTPHTL